MSLNLPLLQGQLANLGLRPTQALDQLSLTPLAPLALYNAYENGFTNIQPHVQALHRLHQDLVARLQVTRATMALHTDTDPHLMLTLNEATNLASTIEALHQAFHTAVRHATTRE
jgi:hypothetical protein